MGWWSRLLRRGAPEARGVGASEYIEAVLAAQEAGVLRTSMGTLDEEQIGSTLSGIVKSNGPIFALTLARMQVFSQARFQWARFERGEETDLFGSPELRVLERPWVGGTTADLLARMELDVTAAGNSYVRRIRRMQRGRVVSDRLVRLRPDWVTIVLASAEDADHPSEAADVELLGYVYTPHGDTSRMVMLGPEEVAHYAPVPDPDGVFVGMSWVTPVIRDVLGDNLQTDHKRAFLRNSATPNLVIKFDPTVTVQQVKEFKKIFEAEHAGAENAYKCLHPETQVAMWDGSRCRADDVKAGDEVVAWADGRAVAGRVSAAEWQPPSPIVTVRTQRGRVIRTNDRHPFLARRVTGKHDPYLSDETWIAARNLRAGDLLTAGLGWATDDVADSLTPHEAWVLGVLVGDGCIVSTTPVVSAWDDGVRSRLEIGHTLKATGKGHDYRVLGVRGLCARAGLVGKRSWEKRIPDQVMRGSAKVRAAFLSGLIDADGHVADPRTRRSAEVGITSVSPELLKDAQHLLASLGVNASVSLSMPAGRGGRERDAWRLHVFGNAQARRLAQILDLACDAKASRLAEYAHRPTRGDRSRYDRVVSVEVGAAEPTIGLEIAEHHTHVTGGVVTHNTLFLGGGADPQAIGANFKEIEFSVTQGKAESRLASAAGVPPSWVGFSEGLQGSALNAGNFTAARRRFGDGTLAHLWENAAASLQTIVVPPDDRAHLAVSTRGIPFLAMDASDRAAVQEQEARTIVTLVKDGFTHASAVDAVINHDWSRLQPVTDAEGNPMLSVQLQSPQANPTQPDSDPQAGDPPADSNGNADPDRARALIGGRT